MHTNDTSQFTRLKAVSRFSRKAPSESGTTIKSLTSLSTNCFSHTNLSFKHPSHQITLLILLIATLHMMRRAQDRRVEYKKGIDGDKTRRQREATTVQIRKAKKEEQLAKRRTASTTTSMLSDSSPTGGKNNLPTLADIPKIIGTLRDPTVSRTDRLEAVRMARRMLSVENNPPVQQVIQSGLLAFFVGALACDDDPSLQFEAAWALTNIASTSFTNVVVEAGPIPGLVRLLECPNADVREQAVWCLGNIAGDCPGFRDMVLGAGALPAILKNIEHWANESLIGNMVWAVSNLCRGKPQPDILLVRDSIPALFYVISRAPNSDIITDVAWALSYISDGNVNRIEHVVHTVPILIALLENNTSTITLPALRTLGNIVTGNERQTQMVIDGGLLTHALKILEHPKKGLRKEMCWVLSNIAAGTPSQISSLLKTKGVMATVVNYARTAMWEVRKEAIWTVSNAFTGGDHIQVQNLVDLDGIDTLCEVLDLTDTGLQYVALDAIEQLLRVGDAHGKDYRMLLDECDGISKIEHLQQHTSDKIYEKVVNIIEKLLGGDDHTDENLVPDTAGDAYVFGLQSKNLFGSPYQSTTQSPKFNFGQSPSVQSPLGGSNKHNGFKF